MNLQHRTALLILLTVFPVMLGMGLYLKWQMEQSLLERIHKEQLLHIQKIEQTIKIKQDQIRDALQVIAKARYIRQALDQDSNRGIFQALNRTVSIYPYFRYLLIIDQDKQVFAVSTRDAQGNPLATYSLLGKTVTSWLPEELFINQPTFTPLLQDALQKLFSPNSNVSSQWFSAPIRPKGIIEGWVVADYAWKPIMEKMLKQYIEELTHVETGIIGITFQDTKQNVLVRAYQTHAALENSSKNQRSFKLGSGSYTIQIDVDQSKVLLPVTEALISLFWTMLIATLSIVFVLYFANRFWIIHPIHTLTTAMEAFRQGNWRYRLQKRKQDEIGLLVDAYNEMAETLYELNTKLEHKVQQRTQELEQKNQALHRSNQELDSFAYVASHDLKAPLRGIDQLATWIAEDIDNKKETTNHLQMMRNRISRMENLLEDLLAYSRVGREEGKLKTINTSHLLQALYELVTPPDGFQLVLSESLPTFETLSAPFEQVFRNLINNAIKHHEGETGKIIISAEQNDKTYRFKVQDDGPGIAPQYHEKIFALYQTLKPRDQVEGSGMGLAIIKKIVQTYGGDISVDSDIGQGACFCVTWPKVITPHAEETT